MVAEYMDDEGSLEGKHILQKQSMAATDENKNSSSEWEIEKFVEVVVINKVVKASNQLHIFDDLSFSILSKLPLKSLKRFGCVQKSWTLLFKNPQFINMYQNNFLSKDHFYYYDTSLLLHQRIYELHSHFSIDEYVLHLLSRERFENKVKLDWPNPFPSAALGFDILGPCCINGIFCLFSNFLRNTLLWNPATNEFKVIPLSPVDSRHLYGGAYVDQRGFSYDPVRDDYKVFRRIPRINHELHWLPKGDVPYEDISFESLWEIYSLRSNSWKKYDVDMPCAATREYVYMDGLCHWWSKSETHNEAYMVSFDSGNEVFFTTPIPSDMDDNFVFMWRHSMVLNGSIALISTYGTTSTFHISILGELSVKESWIKLFIVGPLPCLKYPIGVGKSGIFFKKKDGDLVWFDLNTQGIEELGIGSQRSYSKIVIYKESLLPIVGIND